MVTKRSFRSNRNSALSLLTAPLALVLALGAVTVGLTGCTREKPRRFQLQNLAPVEPAAFEAAVYQTTGATLVAGNEVELIHDGEVFTRMAAEIRKARRSVNLVSFIWRQGKASDQLLEAIIEQMHSQKNLKCRVLVDPFGSTGFEEKVKPVLTRAGCAAHIFRPLPADETLARNHRKILIVDGALAFTGGFGIQDQWLGDGDSEKEWRDVNVRVRGPVVSQMQQAFAENWQETTGQFLPSEDFPLLPRYSASPQASVGGAAAAFISSTASPELTTAERITQLLVQSARKRLWISQSYFTPNAALLALLVARAKAGVDVRVIAPGDKNDHPEITALQRATYDSLLAAGVGIWEYAPSMMHAKTMLVDDELVLVGSINYDILSFNLLEEGSLLVRDEETARALEKSFLADAKRSRQIHAQKRDADTRDERRVERR